MNLIMYLRKSREDIEREKSTGEDTLQSHRSRLSALCHERNYAWQERAEVVSGDTIAGRPVFQHVLERDIPSGLYQAIMVTEISRLGRGDMEDAGRIYKTLIQYSLKVITPYRIYDPTNTSDLRQLRFELFLSREEYELIRDRLFQGREHKAKQGYAGNNVVTMGYDQYRGVLKVNKEEAQLVLAIFEMRAKGMSYQEIADDMNRRKARTKRGTIFHQTTIGKLLRNVRYIGKSKWRGEVIEGKCEPIIPMELWNKVHQEVNPQRTHAPQQPRDNVYLVRLYCHECGCRMYGEKAIPKKLLISGVLRSYNSYPVYICTGRRLDPKCNHTIKAQGVHDAALEQLRLIADNLAVLVELEQERTKFVQHDKNDLRVRLQDTKKLIRDKEQFLVRCERDYTSGELTAVLYTNLFEKTQAEIAALNNEARRLKSLIDNTVDLMPPREIIQNLKSILNKWDALDNRERKQIIALFLPRIEVDKAGNYYFSRNLPHHF